MKKIKAQLMWPSLREVSSYSGKYQVDLCQLSDKAVEALSDMGLKVKIDSEKGNFMTCYSQHPIIPFDVNGDEIVGVKVGNGSEAVVAVDTYPWTNPKRPKETGVSPSIKKLVVTELKVYEPKAQVAITAEDDDIL